MSKKVWNNPEIAILGLESTKQPQTRPYIGCAYKCGATFSDWEAAEAHERDKHGEALYPTPIPPPS